ncbi:hypothetical protein NQ317_019362 [Molorchus minor]|uniref:Uncharacterized protein n=1 Tax=Molorchus minor TaxID=1323400 RepID=A0ABQ9JAZ3_9CUCU|nr:hypothetical protein NQ317_019362 [Molorchus minor]
MNNEVRNRPLKFVIVFFWTPYNKDPLATPICGSLDKICTFYVGPQPDDQYFRILNPIVWDYLQR